MKLARVILFVRNMATMTAFYRDVLGLPVKSEEQGWVEFDGFALHRGASKPGSTKLAFGSKDVVQTREELIARGARMGKLKDYGGLVLCDGKDPEGNLFQISNRPWATSSSPSL